MAVVTDTDALSTTCQLLEYGGMTATIPLTEVSHKLNRKTGKPARPLTIGQTVVLVVLESTDGHVSLSRRRVTPEESELHTAYYQKYKKCMSVVRRLAEIHDTPVPHLRQQLLDPLYEMEESMYETPYDALHAFHFQQTDLTQSLDTFFRDQGGDVVMTLHTLVDHHFKKPMADYTLGIELMCYGPRGVEGIKEVLAAGQEADPRAHITVVASPLYTILVKDDDAARGQERLDRVLAAMTKVIPTIEGARLVISTQRTQK